MQPVIKMEIVKIPRERIPVLLGDKGETKKRLEKALKLKLNVTEEEGVELVGESVDEFFGKDVLKAIGRGFAPDVALKLLKEDYCLRIIDLRDYANDNGIIRIKGRVIGENGRTKEIIEEEAESHLSIYGHTVGIIASLETIDVATNAVFKLIEGANHSTVYAYMERTRRKLKEERIKNMF